MLPDAKPRYVMGVGYPEDLVVSVALGADMFDCVWPTRTAVSLSLMIINLAEISSALETRSPLLVCSTCAMPYSATTSLQLTRNAAVNVADQLTRAALELLGRSFIVWRARRQQEHTCE